MSTVAAAPVGVPPAPTTTEPDCAPGRTCPRRRQRPEPDCVPGRRCPRRLQRPSRTARRVGDAPGAYNDQAPRRDRHSSCRLRGGMPQMTVRSAVSGARCINRRCREHAPAVSGARRIKDPSGPTPQPRIDPAHLRRGLPLPAPPRSARRCRRGPAWRGPCHRSTCFARCAGSGRGPRRRPRTRTTRR